MLLPKLSVTTASDQATCLIRAHSLNDSALRITRAKRSGETFDPEPYQEIPSAKHVPGVQEIKTRRHLGRNGTKMTSAASEPGRHFVPHQCFVFGEDADLAQGLHLFSPSL